MKALGIEVKLQEIQLDQLIDHIKENYFEVYHRIYMTGWDDCVSQYHHMQPECCASCSEGCIKSPCGNGYIPVNAQHYYGDGTEDYDE